MRSSPPLYCGARSTGVCHRMRASDCAPTDATAECWASPAVAGHAVVVAVAASADGVTAAASETTASAAAAATPHAPRPADRGDAKRAHAEGKDVRGIHTA